MKNMGRRFVAVTVRINLVVDGKTNYSQYKAKEIECIPNTFEESEQLFAEIEAVMRKYGVEKPSKEAPKR